MLTPGEEIRALQYYKNTIGLEPAQMHFCMDTPAFQWLSVKVVELNEEVKRLKREKLESKDK